MKHPNNTEDFISSFFEEMKREEQTQSPSFSNVYGQAKKRYYRRKILWFSGIALVLLSLFLGIWQVAKQPNAPKEDIQVLRAGVKFYDRLMEEGKIITNDIHFEYDKATLKSESLVIIHAIANMMKTHTKLKLSIEGHTDNSGSSEYNHRLSSIRAAAVKDAILELGIENNRLTSNGYGESQPVYDNETEEGRQKNRRVEFVLIEN